jgi:hypothetical protein
MRPSLTKERSPVSKLSVVDCDSGATLTLWLRVASEAGMYSLIATSRSSAWSKAR